MKINYFNIKKNLCAHLIKVIIGVSVILLAGACKKNENQNVSVKTDLTLSISNTSGNDLLDPEFVGNINYQNTELYYFIDGKRVRQFEANLDLPKKFSITDYKGLYTLRVWLNTNADEDGFSTSILEYADYPADTIRAKVYKTKSSTGISEVLINGKQVSGTDLIKLTKEITK